MMKKIVNLSFLIIGIISTVMISITEVRAVENNEIEAENSSVFQKASDVINGKYEDKAVPSKKIRIFQIIADGIDKVERADITPVVK